MHLWSEVGRCAYRYKLQLTVLVAVWSMPLQVAALHANTVILLHPEGTGSAANAEAIKASAAMCLTALGRNPHQRVVVQMPGARDRAQG